MTEYGLESDEEVVLSINATTAVYDEDGYVIDESISGELLLTDAGTIVFLKGTGMFKKGRKRIHYLSQEYITDVREVTKGISIGGLRGKVDLILTMKDDDEEIFYFSYTCGKEDCARFLSHFNDARRVKEADRAFDNRLLLLIKPREEVLLTEIAKDDDLLDYLAIIWKTKKENIEQEELMKVLRDVTAGLITNGELEGFLENDTYIAKSKLSRKSVQYHVTIDFSSLFSQLKYRLDGYSWQRKDWQTS